MEKFATLPGSNTANVVNVSSTSNVGIPGMWMFQVNSVQIIGMTRTITLLQLTIIAMIFNLAIHLHVHSIPAPLSSRSMLFKSMWSQC